jgi:hypothetical protein
MTEKWIGKTGQTRIPGHLEVSMLMQILHSAAYADTPTLERKLRDEIKTQDPGLMDLFSMISIKIPESSDRLAFSILTIFRQFFESVPGRVATKF